ncbi:MAG: FG-GAP repeat protein [Methanosarcinales archaeon]|nr:FG-GAP repeat protein [Methanosarcinales archaeon]
MVSRIKLSKIFRIGAAALIVTLLAGLSAGADTWTQTTDADFENGETFMVEIDGGALKLARGLNNQWHGIGEAEDDYFGYAVASAGDVNGDGYDDVVVGAYHNDSGGINAGKAYVYLGSASGISTTASWIVTGEAGDDYFGYSVASAGDVNCDGYDDVIVSAHGNNDGGNDIGKAYVYLGSASGLSTTASWTATGEAAYDYFGSFVASAGDVNGDDYDDVIVSANGGDDAGKAYVYLGSATGLRTTASWAATGEAAYDYFGKSVASAGDVNGDGYDDVIVGAYGNNDGGNDAGKAYVYLGSASGLRTTVSWTAAGEAAYDYFGSSVASAGDVNGDGYDDVVVGAHGNDNGGNNVGKAYVYLGFASGLSTTVSWTATGEASVDHFGSSVASAGDVNGDGYDDIIVGAYHNDDGGFGAGKAYVYLGSASGLSTTVLWTATGEAAYDYFGSSVASAGDVNGDGYDDVVVGAYGNDNGGSDAGKTYTYQNLDLWTLEVVKWTAAGDAAYDHFGASVASAGDVNGDGYDDVIVGAHSSDSGGNDAGKAYVYLGSASGLSTTTSWTATGEAAGDYFGSSVASAGDVNGDGYDDVIVGAYGNNDGGNDAGKAYVYLGSASGLSTTVAWTVTGEVMVDYFGSSVASAGDVNDDGYDDVIVGAHHNNDGGGDAGKAYLYLGSASGLSTTVAWTATGEVAYDHFGSSVASTGDVNGDGYDDVIVGAHYNDDGGNNAGKAYVYLGSASGLSTTASWTATGEAAGDYLGSSVASAGDMDGDGYDDVIISAHGNNDGSNDAGKAYVYLGSASGLSTTVSWTETGEVAVDYFGSSVASAGDVDGDGYGDVIVSSHGNNDGSNDAGKAYVYGGTGYCEHGAFASEKFSMSDSNIIRWMDISWNPVTQPDGTGVRFQIGTSNDGKSFVYLGPDGTANTYYTNPAGQAIYSEQIGKVWRYKALLYSDERKVKTPTITDVSIVYEEYPYTAPVVDVTSPNGGEVLVSGEETQIMYDASGNLGAAPISLYYSTNHGGNWMYIARGMGNTGTFTWTVPHVETEVALVKAVVTDIIDNTDSDISDATFVIGLEKDSINLFAGWNFVSTPVKLNNYADEVQQVFSGVDTGDNPIYLYDGGAWNVMGGSDIMMALDGVWIYSTDDAAVSLNFDTDPLPVPPTKNLEASWNAIGHSSIVPVQANSALSSVESEWTSLIGFDASEQSYKPAIINDDETGSSSDEDNPMYPTKGYWLHMISAGELEGLSAGTQATMAKQAATANAAGVTSSAGVPLLPEAYYGTITINDIPAPLGTEIIAMIKGIEKGRFTTTAVGIYGGSGTFDPKLIVAGDEFDVGRTITFRINGIPAYQTDTYNSGTSTNLYLSAGDDRVRGDLNGDYMLTSIDAAIALEIAVGSRPFDDIADVNRDGKVTSIDALMILQAAAGVISF